MTKLAELQNSIYTDQTNFCIEYTGTQRGCVAVYLTSNNLFYPHNEEMFRKAVIEKNRFEWTRLKIKRAQKHIFLRDIYKQWYGIGINKELDSIDKVVEWLKDEVKGYSSIICIGSSGGGYFASIIGSKLQADLVLNFNGQWDIHDSIEDNGIIISPVLKKMLAEKHPGIKYFNIVREEFDYSRIFYFVSSKSPVDIRQLELASSFKNIHIIRFSNSHHGIPFLKCTLSRVINMTYEELCELENHEHLPVLFDIKLIGLTKTAGFLLKLIKKKFIRR